MKFTVEQKELHNGLKMVARAVATRAVVPATTCVLVTAAERTVTLTAYNGELAIVHSVPAIIEETGGLCLAWSLFNDVVAALPDGHLTLGLQPHSLCLEMTRETQKPYRKDSIHINGLRPADFPPLLKVEGGIDIPMKAGLFKAALHHVDCAASTDTDHPQPTLTGISVNIDRHQMTMTAADGFRLARYSIPVQGKDPVTFLLPANVVPAIFSVLQWDDADIVLQVSADRRRLAVQGTDTQLLCVLLQGAFPDAKRLIPTNVKSKAVVNRDELLRAAKIVRSFADGGPIRMEMAKTLEKQEGALGIYTKKAESYDSGAADGRVEIAAQVDGPLTKAAFNPKYVIDGLTAITEQQVSLELTGPSTASLLRTTTGDIEYIYVLMPMFVVGL